MGTGVKHPVPTELSRHL